MSAVGVETPAARERAWLASFVALSAVWGASFLFIKIALRSFAAVDVALARVALGALPLLALAALRRDPLPRDRRAWGHLFVAALLFNAVPFSLIAFGETHVSSILAGLWNATTPLLTLLAVTALLPGERPTRRRITGVLIGFAGVVVVLGPWRRVGAGALVGDLACLGASACYGVAFAYSRRHLAGRTESSVALSAAQLSCASAQLAIAAPLLGTLPRAVSAESIGAILGLGVLGTGLAYVLNYGLIRSVGAAIASTVTYVVPLFATVLGVVVLGEGLLWHEPVGACVVLAGVAVSSTRAGALSRSRQSARHPPGADAAARRDPPRPPVSREPR